MVRRKRDLLGRLYALYAETNERYFASLLPAVPILIEPIGLREAKLWTAARLWSWDGKPNRIVLDERFALRHSWAEVREVLLHEMVHIWQAMMGRDGKHDVEFKRMAARLGVRGGARVD